MNLSYLTPGALLSSCTSSLVRSLDLSDLLCIFSSTLWRCSAAHRLFLDSKTCPYMFMVWLISFIHPKPFISCVCIWIVSAELNMIWFVGMHTQTNMLYRHFEMIRFYDHIFLKTWLHTYILLMIYTLAPSLALP